jgi:hypothetical protein
MKRFYGSLFFFLFVFCVGVVTPAFASVSISVEAIDPYSDGADVLIVIYENGSPASLPFGFELFDKEGQGGVAYTDEYGEALIEFRNLASDTYFEGIIWVGDYDDPEYICQFSFSTDSSLEEAGGGGCNAGVGSGFALFALAGLVIKLGKKR